MRIGLYASTLGSIEQQKCIDVISNNIANAGTPGFKKDDIHFRGFLDATGTIDLEQGPVRQTGCNMDIALEGEGFLKVRVDDDVAYTRAGNLTLDANHNLVTQSGRPVLGKSGPIRLEKGDLRITPEGQVFDKDAVVDSLDIVKFPKGTVLEKTKGGFLAPKDKDVDPVAAPGCKVQQGALEGANFNIVEEMVRMVDSMRVFEAYQKASQTFDRDLDGQLITKLGFDK
jgi:flagellar basal-body rod protein FlgF